MAPLDEVLQLNEGLDEFTQIPQLRCVLWSTQLAATLSELVRKILAGSAREVLYTRERVLNTLDHTKMS